MRTGALTAGRLLAGFAVAACVLAAAVAEARPRYRRNLRKHYGDLLPPALDACTTCHVRSAETSAATVAAVPGDGQRMPPHNPFGARLRRLGDELREKGEPSDLFARLERAAAEDADGDGVANELEILAGRAPGREGDTPTSGELAGAREKLEVLRERLAGYRWRPFRPVVRPPVPEVRDRARVRNPIDAFIASRREERGLSPRPEAPPRVLLRRLHLDLVGLPPRPRELRAFLADPSPEAYERVADRLLDSPHHGERWGRHWMDVWRYSDWAGWGKQVRDSQPHIWRWRDWIVESLNADKGYDRMLLEMIAGDELAPLDPETVRATGYLARSYKRLSREAWMQETVDHLGRAFLGLTVGCARCHDHMYDPISQEEYYRLRAVFEPHRVRVDRVPGEPDVAKDGLARVFDAELDAPTWIYERGDDRRPLKDRPIAPGVPAFLSGKGYPRFEVRAVPLPLGARVPDKRDFVIAEERSAAARAVEDARAAFRDALLAAAKAERAAREAEGDARAQAESHARAAREKAELAEMDVPLAEARFRALEATLRVEAIEDAGGRERDPEGWKEAATLASSAERWLALLEARRDRSMAELVLERARASEEAARAADSGTAGGDDRAEGDAGKAAAALEKAASERKKAEAKLTEAEKALAGAEEAALLEPSTEYARRELETYPASSSGRRLALARWIADRRNPLTARVAVNHIWLRHFGSALAPSVADLGANGREPSHPALLDWLAAELMEPSDPEAAPWSMKRIHRLIVTSSTYRMASTPDEASLALDPENRWLWRMSSRRLEAEAIRDSVLHVAGKLDTTFGGPELDHRRALSTRRRSIYYRHAPEKRVEFLRLFDMAAPNECYERRTSVVPQQALALLNSELALVMARHLARSLLAGEGGDARGFIEAAFERVLARPPTAEETTLAADFLAEQERLFEQARRDECLAAFAGGPEDAERPSGDPAVRARENLVHSLMNHHEFVTAR